MSPSFGTAPMAFGPNAIPSRHCDRWHKPTEQERRGPSKAIWSSVLTLSGSYDQLTDSAIFALTLFYAFVAGSVFVFRRRMPTAPRPYRTWGYPVVPMIFIIVTAWLIFRTIWDNPKQSAIGLGLILIGLPVYLIWARRDRRMNEE